MGPSGRRANGFIGVCQVRQAEHLPFWDEPEIRWQAGMHFLRLLECADAKEGLERSVLGCFVERYLIKVDLQLQTRPRLG